MEIQNSGFDGLMTLLSRNPINYKGIAKNSHIRLSESSEEDNDVNVIIPVRGRVEFLSPLYSSLKKAQENTDKKITYTVIEHSFSPEHEPFCKDNGISYIWIKAVTNELFNKCIALNMGVFTAKYTKYLLFHDLDCLVQSDFFRNLFSNVEKKKARAIQCFTGRRVLYLDEKLTAKAILESLDVDSLDIDNPGVSLPQHIGAPGGSIMVERDLFFDAGGYDAELFIANSPEDAVFWEKVETLTEFHVCDDPINEIYHMNHPPMDVRNPHWGYTWRIYQLFKSLYPVEKENFINYKSRLIIPYAKRII